MEILGYVLTGIAALLVLLGLMLAIPLQLAFSVQGIEGFHARIRMRWLFGALKFDTRMPRLAQRRASPARSRVAAHVRPAKDRRRHSHDRWLAALRQAPFRRRLLRLLADLYRAAHLSPLRLQARLGLGDPADTGRLWALIGPLGAWAQGQSGAQIRIEPEFVDAVIEFDADGCLRLIPIQLLGLVLAFAVSPESIRAWRGLEQGDGAH